MGDFHLFKWGAGWLYKHVLYKVHNKYFTTFIGTLSNCISFIDLGGEFSFTLQAYENCPPNYITLTLYNEEKSSVSYVISKAYIYTWGIITSISHKTKHIVQ